jgi:hypothetical protein
MSAPGPAWNREFELPLSSTAPITFESVPAMGQKGVFAYCAAAFVLGSVRLLTVSQVGAMPVGELVLLALLGHALLWIVLFQRLPVALPSPRLIGLFAVCQALALMSYILSDLWRNSFPVDMIRGWLRMVFVLLDMGGLALLMGVGRRAFIFFQIGSSISCVSVLFLPPLFGDYWKFGLAYPVTVLVLLIIPYWFGFWATVLAFLGLGVLHAVMDFRSFGGICVCLCFLLSLRALPKLTRKSIMGVGGAAVLLLMPWISEKMFSNTGGRTDRSNVERSSMLSAAWEGFLASPVIGNGSWFSNSNVMDNFLLIRAERERLGGGGMGFDNTAAEGLSIHSQMLVTLAEGGLVGGAFFFCYGIFILWAIWFALGDAAWDWTLPSRLFLLVNSFWDLWMSPFSGPVRINIALTVILIAIFWRERAQLRASRLAQI